MIVRVGPARDPEQLALARLLVQTGRLPHPAQRRRVLSAIWDTYAVGVPARRARILGWLLTEARQIEESARQRSRRARLDELGRVHRPG